MPVGTIVLRLAKGSPVTPGEMDQNLTNLRDFSNLLETLYKTSFDGTTGLFIPAQFLAAAKTAGLAGNGLIQALATDVITVGLDNDTAAGRVVTLELDGSTPPRIRVKAGSITTNELATGVLGTSFGSQVILTDERTAGTDGDAYTAANGWSIRPLSTIRRNVNSSLVGNAIIGSTFKLEVNASGSAVYRVNIRSMMACSAGLFKSRLRNYSTSVTALNGTTAYSAGTSTPGMTIISGLITVTSNTHVYQIEHWAGSNGSFGQGLTTTTGSNPGNEPEVHCVAEFVREP